MQLLALLVLLSICICTLNANARTVPWEEDGTVIDADGDTQSSQSRYLQTVSRRLDLRTHAKARRHKADKHNKRRQMTMSTLTTNTSAVPDLPFKGPNTINWAWNLDVLQNHYPYIASYGREVVAPHILRSFEMFLYLRSEVERLNNVALGPTDDVNVRNAIVSRMASSALKAFSKTAKVRFYSHRDMTGNVAELDLYDEDGRADPYYRANGDAFDEVYQHFLILKMQLNTAARAQDLTVQEIFSNNNQIKYVFLRDTQLHTAISRAMPAHPVPGAALGRNADNGHMYWKVENGWDLMDHNDRQRLVTAMGGPFANNQPNILYYVRVEGQYIGFFRGNANFKRLVYSHVYGFRADKDFMQTSLIKLLDNDPVQSLDTIKDILPMKGTATFTPSGVTDKADVRTDLGTTKAILQNLNGGHPFQDHFKNFFDVLLDGIDERIDNIDTQHDTDWDKARMEHIGHSIYQLNNLFETMVLSQDDFLNFVQLVDSAFEYIDQLVLLSIANHNIEDLRAKIEANNFADTTPADIQTEIANGNINQEAFVFPSGMRAITEIVLALGTNAAFQANTVVYLTKNSYFESKFLLDNIGRLFTNNGAVTFDPNAAAGAAANPIEDIQDLDARADKHIIFLDLFPNDGTADDITPLTLPRLSLLMQAHYHNGGTQLVLVIDTTMHFILDGIVTQLLDMEINGGGDKVKHRLANDDLIIVFVNSLAKYAQAGGDEKTGGIVRVLGHPGNIVFGDLRTAETNSPISCQSASYFGLLFDNAVDSIVYASSWDDIDLAISPSHLDIIRKNNQKLYHELQALHHGQGTALEVGLRSAPNPATVGDDPNWFKLIPAVSFHVPLLFAALGANNNNKMVNVMTLVQHYILAIAHARGLSMTSRGGFGYAISNLVDASFHLRLTVGLEKEIVVHDPANNVRNFVELFTDINTQLDNYINTNPGNVNQINLKNAVSQGIRDPAIRDLVFTRTGEAGTFREFLAHLTAASDQAYTIH